MHAFFKWNTRPALIAIGLAAAMLSAPPVVAATSAPTLPNDSSQWIGERPADLDAADVVVLFYWGGTDKCPPCVNAINPVAHAMARYRKDGVHLIGVADPVFGGSADQVREFLWPYTLAFPSVFDPAATSQLESLGVKGLPAAVLYGPGFDAPRPIAPPGGDGRTDALILGLAGALDEALSAHHPDQSVRAKYRQLSANRAKVEPLEKELQIARDAQDRKLEATILAELVELTPQAADKHALAYIGTLKGQSKGAAKPHEEAIRLLRKWGWMAGLVEYLERPLSVGEFRSRVGAGNVADAVKAAEEIGAIGPDFVNFYVIAYELSIRYERNPGDSLPKGRQAYEAARSGAPGYLLRIAELARPLGGASTDLAIDAARASARQPGATQVKACMLLADLLGEKQDWDGALATVEECLASLPPKASAADRNNLQKKKEYFQLKKSRGS